MSSKQNSKGISDKVFYSVLGVCGFVFIGFLGLIMKNLGVGAPVSPSPELVVVAAIPSAPASIGKMWVTADRLARHTCPSSSCGVVGQQFFREATDVMEINGDWARISKRYDASCSGGKSIYVDEGNASCTAENGIEGGQFAEWVEIKYLSPERPADPAAGATGLRKLVAGSDDFRIYEAVFVKAAQTLIERGECTEADFDGGFLKSTFNKGPVYFIYCGGMTAANRVYLDAGTGRTYR
jgi:hypothetical protein